MGPAITPMRRWPRSRRCGWRGSRRVRRRRSRMAGAVGAQRQDMGNLIGSQLGGEVVVESRRGQDEPVDSLPEQCLGRGAFGIGVVLCRGDDGEARSLCAGAGDLLEQDRHHGVGQPRNEHADGAGVLSAQRGGVDVPAVTELEGGVLTRSAVADREGGSRSSSIRETVEVLTPASRATSWMVAGRWVMPPPPRASSWPHHSAPGSFPVTPPIDIVVSVTHAWERSWERYQERSHPAESEPHDSRSPWPRPRTGHPPSRPTTRSTTPPWPR